MRLFESVDSQEVRRWTRKRWVRVTGLVSLVILTFIGWRYLRGDTVRQRADAAIETLDPVSPKPVFEALTRARRRGLEGPQLRERRAFVEAVNALATGQDSGAVTDALSDKDPETPWGWAARGSLALVEGDIEAAERVAARLTRTLPPDHLLRIWVRGRVDEARGRLAEASESFRKGTARHPQFLAFLLGQLRIAVRQMDESRLQPLLAGLAKEAKSHAYLQLRLLKWPTLFRSGSAEKVQPLTVPGAFGAALDAYTRAHRALRRHDYGSAVKASTEALVVDPRFSPARWIRATARAALFRAEAADEDFEVLRGRGSLAARWRCRLHGVAPRLLSDAGRVDLGSEYVSTQLGVGSSVPGESAVTAPAVGTEDICAEQPAKLRARVALAAADTAANHGDLMTARQWLDSLWPDDDPSADLAERHQRLEAMLDVRGGRRPIGPGEDPDSSVGESIFVMQKYLEGDIETVVDEGGAWLERRPDDSWMLRWVTLAMAESGRGRRALESLRRADIPPVFAADHRRLEARVRARLANGEAVRPPPTEWAVSEGASGVDFQIDATAVALWTQHMDRALEHAEAAYRRQPRHPEVNWWRGMTLRALDRRAEARQYLRRSWRASPGGPRLAMELGYVNLAAEEYTRAADAFFRALLADPKSVEAIRGLGRAYAASNPDEGRWNFKRILENYGTTGSDAVYAGEVLRWLGVFRGSRDGEARGGESLERAREVAGNRPVILLELGRFKLARQEFEEAKDWFLKALAKDSTLAEAHLGLAKVGVQSNDTRLVRTHLNRYLALKPAGDESDWARTRLDSIRSNDAAAGAVAD